MNDNDVFNISEKHLQGLRTISIELQGPSPWALMMLGNGIILFIASIIRLIL